MLSISSSECERIKKLICKSERVGFYLNYDLKGNNTSEVRDNITKALKSLNGIQYIPVNETNNQTSGIVLSANLFRTKDDIASVVRNEANKGCSLSKLILIVLCENDWIIDDK